jgi:hypothetical protein
MQTLTTTPTVKPEIKLAPKLRRQLVTELHAVRELSAQVKAIQGALDMHKATISRLREETGENTLEIDGFRITLVQPSGRATLDTKQLLLNGVSMAQIENSTVVKPVKAYTKVTVPDEVPEVF